MTKPGGNKPRVLIIPQHMKDASIGTDVLYTTGAEIDENNPDWTEINRRITAFKLATIYHGKAIKAKDDVDRFTANLNRKTRKMSTTDFMAFQAEITSQGESAQTVTI